MARLLHGCPLCCCWMMFPSLDWTRQDRTVLAKEKINLRKEKKERREESGRPSFYVSGPKGRGQRDVVDWLVPGSLGGVTAADPSGTGRLER